MYLYMLVIPIFLLLLMIVLVIHGCICFEESRRRQLLFLSFLNLLRLNIVRILRIFFVIMHLNLDLMNFLSLEVFYISILVSNNRNKTLLLNGKH